jgi:uncharacterized protein
MSIWKAWVSRRAKAAGITDDKLDVFVAALPDADRTKAEAAAIEWREKKQVMP